MVPESIDTISLGKTIEELAGIRATLLGLAGEASDETLGLVIDDLAFAIADLEGLMA